MLARRRRLIGHLLPLALSATLSAAAAAQTGAGTILGQVTGVGRRVLASAAVWIDSTPIMASTDDNGRYRVQRVPAGHHRLLARFIGYDVATRDVNVIADSGIVVDV